ncbi:MAG: hypothetical protein JNJ83_14160 [Verrucomicrobiaceae bacterium]|nr:hypothetical protein [Verrucomicrobiaceae bacterium]
MNPPSIAPSVVRPFWKRPFFVVAAIVLGTAGITAAASVWWVKHNFYASTLNPVALSNSEKEALDSKLVAMSAAGQAEATPQVPPTDPKKTLQLSEREINAFLADQGLGEQVKVELGNGSGVATAIVPIEKDAPMFGGKTLRIQCAFNARMDAEKKLAFSISDISVGGISLPNAWLGNIKGLNLFQNADISSDPAVKGFVAGVKDFAISGGALRVVLND